MKSVKLVLLWVLLLAIPGGCRTYPPVLGPPGTIRQQQLRATMYDPYVGTDIGPEVVGGRPREYQKPLAEPVRSRFVWDTWLGR
jgi:hypothetical protein